ncbi:hypothetical protein KOEU_23190 [Komagataeibacter europaeus]|uniref:Uncharacterized protein n=1 Tax=Komagataeibacter europaeus TaxID=33995 RepID=A0A0M0EG58_KOMEU|nr:hypothetical protein [Komagataeibacter europaeus]KON64249.1 hypothetical protein KOEU_23190 [Komagataeibacter europaeus]
MTFVDLRPDEDDRLSIMMFLQYDATECVDNPMNETQEIGCNMLDTRGHPFCRIKWVLGIWSSLKRLFGSAPTALT